jgi:4-hydroxy-2-oxoheptanedioate aldolase
VIPQVETVEEAKHAVCAAKFGVSKQPGRPAPRSAPPFRYLPGVTDIRLNPSKTFHQNLNDQAAIMIQIETLEGLRNLDAILTEVPEIDCVWLGTLDFRVSMHLDGNNGMGGPEKEWTDCVDEYQRIVDKHNKPRAGFSFGPPEVLLKAGAGKCMNIVAADGAALMGLMEAGQVAKKTLPRLNGGRKLNGTANGTTNGFAEHTEA